MLDNFLEDMKGESANRAAHRLFDIAEDATKISHASAELFHHFVAQLLYLSKRARTDIQLAVSFLCTIVIGTETDDYKNLTRLMKYIKGTTDLPLILSINKSGNINVYDEAAFSVHKYMRIHTCGFMTMGTGGACVQSSIQ